ncbi:hypothetical protein MHU86_24316 [Fragilaria crotonensis]|nr:hypothetical protein MHU86_24316 [Fragilaria crotonensis]
MLVHRRGVTAKEAYQELYGAMQARNEVAVCQDVLTWLKAACTARGGEGLQNNVPVVFHLTTPVHLPPEVYRYMIGKVKGDLPALATPDAMTAEVTGTLAGALRALTSARGGGDGAEERSTREPKAIHEFYKETYRTLLRFGNVTTPEAVAPVWRRLANCTKSEQHTILVQEFQRVCMARGLSTEFYVPVVTAGLKQMVTGLQFLGHGVDDLSTGCQPFMVAFTGSTNHRQALESATIGNQLAQGEHSASLTDYVTLRANEKIKFPRDVMEVGITLGRFAVICQTLFQGTGPDNPLIAHQPAVASVFYACILRAVQVRVYDYLHAVSINVSEDHTGVETPDFRHMVSDLKHGTFPHSSNWVPIPIEYREPGRGAGGGTGASRAPPSAVPTAGSSVSTERTGVSSLTTDATPRVPMTPIDNPDNDAAFRAIVVRPGGTRPILRDNPPPQNDAGRASEHGSSHFVASDWQRQRRDRRGYVTGRPGWIRERGLILASSGASLGAAGADNKSTINQDGQEAGSGDIDGGVGACAATRQTTTPDCRLQFFRRERETVQLAPPEAMQFGRALHRVLKRIVEADGRYGPVYLAKIDIADGFYRVWLQSRDIIKLGVVLPTSPGQPPLIAFPLTLPMGWVESHLISLC